MTLESRQLSGDCNESAGYAMHAFFHHDSEAVFLSTLIRCCFSYMLILVPNGPSSYKDLKGPSGLTCIMLDG